MKAFDEIIHQALREGISVRFDPINSYYRGYIVTFSLEGVNSGARISLDNLYKNRVNEIEALALIDALKRLRVYPYEEIYERHFGKGEEK